MLQKIRDNAHGWWTWVLVPLLIIVFAFWGIGSYLGGSFSQNEVAKVNGAAVSVAAFSAMYQSTNNAKNPTQEPGMSQTIKLQVLQTLVNRLLLTEGLQKLGFSVDDPTLNQMIYQIPAFQQNGQFSMQLYQNLLQNIGQTTETLKADLTETYLINQFQNGLLLSEFALPNEITTETNYANRVRDVTVVTVPLRSFAAKTAPTAPEIAAYYTAHHANFMTPLQLKLAYVTISASQFKTPADYAAALNQAANLAFQNAGSLIALAQAFNVPVQTTLMLDTSHPTGILTNRAVLQAVSSNSVLTQANNSNVIPLSPTTAVVVRVLTSIPQQALPLASVQNQIVAQIQNQTMTQNALTTLNSIVNAINQGGNLSALAKAYGFSATTATGVNFTNKAGFGAAALNTILSLGVNQGAMVPLSNTSFMLVEVTKAYPNPKAAGSSLSAQAIQGLWTQIELEQYLASLQDQAKIKINQAVFKQP